MNYYCHFVLSLKSQLIPNTSPAGPLFVQNLQTDTLVRALNLE